MTDLTRPWPFGLTRRNAWLFALGFVVLIAALYWIDRPLSVWATGQSEGVRTVFRWITRWGESDWILIPSFAVMLLAWLLSRLTRERLQAASREVVLVAGFIFVGVGLPSLVSTLLKRAIGRGRPETWSGETPLSFRWLNWSAYDYQGFPSGHATTAFALALVIAFLWPRLFWPAVVGAALISLSRVVEGAHYVTDITAAAALGTLGAYAVRNVFAARGWLFTVRPDGSIERQPLPALRPDQAPTER